MKNSLKLILLNETAIIPTYAHETDAGMDLYANEDYDLSPNEHHLIGTGIAIDIPVNYEIQIRPRSGLAYKNGITVLNSPGTIDSGYRNEIKVNLVNHSPYIYSIKKGDRIAQMVYAPVYHIDSFELVTSFEGETERNLNGYGSSGK